MEEIITIMQTSFANRDIARLEQMRTNYTGAYKLLAGELLIAAINRRDRIPSIAFDYIDMIRKGAA